MVERRERGYVCAVAVHALMVAQDDPEMRAALRGATLVVPDGMPLVWAANLLGEQPRRPRLRPGADARATRSAAPSAATASGSTAAATRARSCSSRSTCARSHPGIQIVGGYSPPFRAADAPRRRTRSSTQINEARPDVLWVGIGVPKQEKWMARMRDRLDVPVMCGVGAAFDFHAGPHLRRRPRGCRSAGSSGSTGSRRSRAGCCRATSTTTRASCWRSRASTWRAQRRPQSD